MLLPVPSFLYLKQIFPLLNISCSNFSLSQLYPHSTLIPTLSLTNPSLGQLFFLNSFPIHFPIFFSNPFSIPTLSLSNSSLGQLFFLSTLPPFSSPNVFLSKLFPFSILPYPQSSLYQLLPL